MRAGVQASVSSEECASVSQFLCSDRAAHSVQVFWDGLFKPQYAEAFDHKVEMFYFLTSWHLETKIGFSEVKSPL